MPSQRIGIFAGSFDPVHKGHVAFALAAIKSAKLEAVYFLPEVKPRRKAEISHISHRVVMLKLAVKPYPKLKVLELPDKQLWVSRTLPRLHKQFPNAELLLLIGSDYELEHMPNWPNIEHLLQKMGLIIAARKTAPSFSLPGMPKELHLLKSPKPDVSSGQIRQAIRDNKKANGSVDAIDKYIKDNWLYSSMPSSNLPSSSL